MSGTTDEIRELERKAYQRGYAAGRKRKARDVRGDKRQAAREAFRQRAFLAALPALIQTGSTWTMDGRDVKTLDDRVELAWRFAHKAAKGV